MSSIILNLSPAIRLTDDQFYEICQTNQDLRFERTASGDLIIMSPTGGESGQKEADIITDLNNWNRQKKLGVVFSSSTGFKLPKGGDRSPDAAWISLERWQSLSTTERKKFPPICPDFLIELRSQTDDLEKLREKMQEYLDNGLRLGWLIDPQNRAVEIYRLGQVVELLSSPSTVSGEDILPDFVLDLTSIFQEE
ncbi:Uma2 family endonuclease [Gloeothece citriformis]|nr:Uma2 family endonuclease [Gloeothece citriformis]